MKTFLKNFNNFIKRHKKQSIIVAIVLIIIIIAIVIALTLTSNSKGKNLSQNTDQISAITTEGIIKEEEYKGLKFTNISLIKEKNMYTMTLDVTNTTNEAIEIQKVNIPLKDKKGNEIITLLGYIGDKLEPKETRTITASTSSDLSKVVTKEITESK